MGLKIRKVVSLGLLGFVIIGYQNCSAPFGVANLDVGASSLTSTTPQKTGSVPVIMASGHMARTVYSCDDGKSWINDISADNSARCWVSGDPNYVECDHNEFAGHGLDYYNGAFYANFGWGFNGSVRKSTDGVHWTTLRSDGWGPGVSASRGKLFLMWGNWKTSDDDGKTWTELNNSLAGILDHPSLTHIGDHLYAGAPNGVALSKDDGATWTQFAGWQAKWGHTIAEGNGKIVSIGLNNDTTTSNSLWAARSSDGGTTWQDVQIASGDYLGWFGLQFNGHEFIAWGNGNVYRSSDGVTWTTTPIVLNSTDTGLWNFNGVVTYVPSTGTYVLLTSNWGAFYSGEKALRSTDGVHWDVLDSAHYTGGHPLDNIRVGMLDASACP